MLSAAAAFVFLLSLLYLSFSLLCKRKRKNQESSFDSAPSIPDFSALLLSLPTDTILLPGGTLLTCSYANIEHIVRTRHETYPRGEKLTTTLQDLLGRGVFNSDGLHWRLQRKSAANLFSTHTLRTFVLDCLRFELNERLIPLLSSAAAADRTINLQDVLDRYAFSNVCRIAFGIDLEVDPAADQFSRAFSCALHLALDRFQPPRRLSWKLARLLSIGSERLLKKELVTINNFATALVREKKAAAIRSGGGGGDLLGRFVEIDQEAPDELLRDMVLSFTIAGKETTSTGMMRFFWLLSSHPVVQQKIIQEINQVRVKHGEERSGEILTLDQLREMNYLHAAVSEALRLYPPVTVLSRVCTEDDTLPDGKRVKKGTNVMYSILALGRSESVWGEDCLEYRPERWLDERGVFQPRSAYQFLVFNAGPRTCLGREMAYLQIKATAASLLERFVIEVREDGADGGAAAAGTAVRMEKGLSVKIRIRDQTA